MTINYSDPKKAGNVAAVEWRITQQAIQDCRRCEVEQVAYLKVPHGEKRKPLSEPVRPVRLYFVSVAPPWGGAYFWDESRRDAVRAGLFRALSPALGEEISTCRQFRDMGFFLTPAVKCPSTEDNHDHWPHRQAVNNCADFLYGELLSAQPERILALGACPSNGHFGLDSQRALWFLGGMAKTFKSWDVDQVVLLPPSVQELVPAGHLAHFVRDLVRESRDVSAILKPYTEDRGFPPYDPTMMTALLLYAYSQGLYASRRIAKACEERVDVMAVTARQSPDFRTISDFRKRHLSALGGLFTQVLQLCQQAGLVSLGHVALDGTKIRANASKHKAMSYNRMKTAEPARAAEVAQWLAQAAAGDAREDAAYGADRRGDELPEWVTNKPHRLEKIRAAKAALEADARGKNREATHHADRPRRGRPRKNPPGTPHDRAQRNFTDPDSRIMKAPDGFIQGYTAQAAVDADHPVIVAQRLTNQASDAHPLEPLLAHIRRNTGRQARELSADAGYCSEHNLTALARRHVRGYVATGRQQHGEASAVGRRKTAPRTRVHAMKIRLKRAGYRSRYRLRKQVVEPVFGQIKQARGFRQFLLRGLSQVAGEWSFVCSAHTVLKLAGARG